MGRKEKEEAAREEAIQEEIRKVKLPRGNQTIGILEMRLGGSRCKVRCLDEDLRKAAESALSVSRASCRDHALTFSWRNCAQQFLGNLVPVR